MTSRHVPLALVQRWSKPCREVTAARQSPSLYDAIPDETNAARGRIGMAKWGRTVHCRWILSTQDSCACKACAREAVTGLVGFVGTCV